MSSSKSHILSTIEQNIKSSSLNFNDPQQFYSHSFVDILQEEKNKKNSQNNLYKLNGILKLLQDIHNQ